MPLRKIHSPEQHPVLAVSALVALHQQLRFKGCAEAFDSAPFHPAKCGGACDPVCTEIQVY